MADKITIEQVNDLVTVLRADASIDAKVQHVNQIKSGIKQHNVPDNCVAPLFDALRVASASQHAVLVNAGFTGLGHLLTRLSLQEPKHVSKEAARTLPLIMEKLGDQKEKFRALAQQCLVVIYKAAPMDAERSVRNIAMGGKNPRAKEQGMQWLLQVHKEHGLQFRPYVPTLMELLEDADGMVRDVAKSTVIELFRNAPNAAKSDLKKQLKNFKVRSAIEQAIVKELAPTSSVVASTSEPEVRPASRSATRPNLAASMSSLSSERPITPMLDAGRPDSVDPVYVNTQRELDEILKEMHQWFDGRETEQNWLKREESVTKLRKLIAGNAASDFTDLFLTGLRGLLDGIIKAVISLRTSLSKEGCSLVQDMANAFGPGIDPMVELLMQTFIKLAGGTKKIMSQLANTTVDTMLSKVTYNTRLMQHIWGACQDKNVQPRTYSSGWLMTVLRKEGHHKERIEHGGGLDLVEKSLKKGLADANPGVRERMRATYWTFAGIWPARAEALMDALDATAQKLLRNDPHNPNSPRRTEGGAARPGLGLSKSTMTSTKPSLRETMLAKKKEALAAKNLPVRPGSAMAHFSPQRTVSSSSTASNVSTATAPVRQRQDATKATGASGMSVAPRRPQGRRPELQPRPATAGPYSVRTHDGASSERTSPPTARTAITPKSIAGSPKRTAQRPQRGHVATASESSLPTPSRAAATASKPAASPRGSPAKTRPRPRPIDSSSPPKANEDFTLVVPTVTSIKRSPPKEAPAPPPPETADHSDSDTAPSTSLKVYEDPFTDTQTTPRPTPTAPAVLEDKPVNADAGNLARLTPPIDTDGAADALAPLSPDKTKQNSRLLDSGIAKVKAQSLDVHGFRKLQAIIRDNKAPLTDDKFDALLTGLFAFLEAEPQPGTSPEKTQDVRAQVLATIRLLLKKSRESFRPHVSRSLESLLGARAAYDAHTHIVAGLELLAHDLVVLGDASEIALVLTRRLTPLHMDARGCRELSMGLHVLRELVLAAPAPAIPTSASSSGSTTPAGEDAPPAFFTPSESELSALAALAARCLESVESSAVRMDAVQLCVALHARVGDARFWDAMRGVKDDPKSLITYYIVKRQRERGEVVA